MNEAKIITVDPTIVVLAEQKLSEPGVLEMAQWVKAHRPHCVPEGGFSSMWDLLPHDKADAPHGNAEAARGNHGLPLWLTDNEVLCEIAGRKCYDSFADAAGKKTNADYFDHLVSMDPMHSSVFYHAKMTFFFAGVSRKFSHQFIRNYVGSDRDEEGSPSQESTRFTHHYGWYVVPPYVLDIIDEATRKHEVQMFREACVNNYREYCTFIERQKQTYERQHPGEKMSTERKKDIHEAAAGWLSMSAETSFVWTTNPMAIRKFLLERCHAAADAEIFRFARVLGRHCFTRWPNLFKGKDLERVRRISMETPIATVELSL